MKVLLGLRIRLRRSKKMVSGAIIIGSDTGTSRMYWGFVRRGGKASPISTGTAKKPETSSTPLNCRAACMGGCTYPKCQG